RSGIFVSAIERSCAWLRRPTLVLFGSAEPDASPSASLIRTAAVGVFVMNVNERSSNTVISTGMIRPFSWAVWALNAFVNSTILTPCWPSAGPTGGAGFACPPGICSLMSVRTFFAIGVRAGRCPSSYLSCAYVVGARSVDLLDLVEAELDRDLALEDVDQHLELLGVGVDVDDLAVEV